MTDINMTDARRIFTDIANRDMFRGDRVCVRKNNKRAFAIVPIEDVELLEALEDQMDVEAARAALKKGKFIKLKDLAKALGV